MTTPAQPKPNLPPDWALDAVREVFEQSDRIRSERDDLTTLDVEMAAIIAAHAEREATWLASRVESLAAQVVEHGDEVARLRCEREAALTVVAKMQEALEKDNECLCEIQQVESVSIGCRKEVEDCHVRGARALALTPETAKDRIAELEKEIARLKEANASLLISLEAADALRSLRADRHAEAVRLLRKVADMAAVCEGLPTWVKREVRAFLQQEDGK